MRLGLGLGLRFRVRLGLGLGLGLELGFGLGLGSPGHAVALPSDPLLGRQAGRHVRGRAVHSDRRRWRRRGGRASGSRCCAARQRQRLLKCLPLGLGVGLGARVCSNACRGGACADTRDAGQEAASRSDWALLELGAAGAGQCWSWAVLELGDGGAGQCWSWAVAERARRTARPAAHGPGARRAHPVTPRSSWRAPVGFGRGGGGYGS